MSAGDQISEKSVFGNIWSELKKLRKEINALKAHPWGADKANALTLDVEKITVREVQVAEINPPNEDSELWNNVAPNSGPSNDPDEKWTVFGTFARTYVGGNKLYATGAGRTAGQNLNVGGLYQESPATPYEVTCRVTLPVETWVANFLIGIFFMSSSGRMFLCYVKSGDGYYTSGEAMTDDGITLLYFTGISYLSTPTVYLKIEDDGEWMTFYTSPDNKNWTQQTTRECSTSGLYPASFGLFVSTLDGFANANAVIPYGTFGRISINAGDQQEQVGNVFSESQPAVQNNFASYSEESGLKIEDSGVTAVGTAAGQYLKTGASAPYRLALSNFAADVRATVLTGLSLATNAAISATDTVLVAMGYLQKQITDAIADILTRMRYSGTWSSATAYALNDVVVTAGGQWYICVSAHTNQTPPNATYWHMITPTGAQVSVDAGAFAGNLDNTIVTAQLLADAVDALPVGGSFTGDAFDVPFSDAGYAATNAGDALIEVMAEASGGGGGGTTLYDRRWVRGSTANAADDEFNDESLDGAWSRIDASGGSSRASWAEGADSLSLILAGGDSAGELHAMLKAHALAVGDYVQCHISASGPSSNYPLAGLVVASGNTHGAGDQATWLFWNTTGFQNLEAGAWSGFNSRGSFSASTGYAWGTSFHMRLVRDTSNVWRYQLSTDAVQWMEIATATISFTPAYIGLVGGTWGGSKMMYSFDYFRVGTA